MSHDHRVKLPATFRYLHAPVSMGAVTSAVGRQATARAFADRLAFSNGGALLVTGFRGVGKTTFVKVALAHIESNRSRYEEVVGPFRLVDVWINLAKPVSAAQLMHLLIRQLYLRLDSLKLMDLVDPALKHDLHTSFMRTCFEISARSVATEERGREMSAGFDKAPLLGLEFLGKIAATAKSTRSDEDVLKYLPYDEKAAETDLLDFSIRLARPLREPPTVRWFRRWWRAKAAGPIPRVKVVFVLDELDKLERFAAATTGNYALDWVLRRGKRTFTFIELYAAAQELNLGGGSERVTREAVERVLRLLTKRGIVVRVSRTILRADRAAAEIAEEYRLAEWVLRALQPVFEAPVAPAVPPAAAGSRGTACWDQHPKLGPVGITTPRCSILYSCFRSSASAGWISANACCMVGGTICNRSTIPGRVPPSWVKIVSRDEGLGLNAWRQGGNNIRERMTMMQEDLVCKR